MKKQFLIGGSTAVFTLLFYDEYLGLNGALYALLLLGATVFKFPQLLRQAVGPFLVAAVLLSSFSFAWLPDFASFFALAASLVLLRIYAANPALKWVFAPPIVLLNFFAFAYRMWQRIHWIEGDVKGPKQYALKVFMYVVIPLVFISGFVAIYILSSAYLSQFLQGIDLNFNLWLLMGCIGLGLCFSFSYWDCWIPDSIKELSAKWQSSFSHLDGSMGVERTSPIDANLERRSGEITLILLNGFLLVFLFFYNYEQFFETESTANLSAQTHQRVNSLILSIVMAIALLLFYFKGAFNFDPKAKRLKGLAQIWIVLNGIMVLSAAIKNMEYVWKLGLTSKRLGVFLFLILCAVGLFYSRRKISRQLTNFYLVNRMVAAVFIAVLVCGMVNWNGVITRYNLAQDKVDMEYLMEISVGSEGQLLHYIDAEQDENPAMKSVEEVLTTRVNEERAQSILSTGLYYRWIHFPDKKTESATLFPND
ncbi:DUF4173 domain-containing protein [Flavobacterium sp. JP2137]|uniref:DUF4153 domain-containing protein n=1 Tax=Flavobacterium sp. JP2137 TaxID=3414510 RepID=UPI003D2FA2AE